LEEEVEAAVVLAVVVAAVEGVDPPPAPVVEEEGREGEKEEVRGGEIMVGECSLMGKRRRR
jgi:hypothetical protein